jgi:hypothetical protein
MFESNNCRSSVTRRFEAIGARVRLGAALVFLALPLVAQTSFSPCDLNQDGTVNAADVQLAINMTLGSIACTASIDGAGVCNVAIVQRVVNAALGKACVTGAGAVPHYVSLSWTASTSSDVVGYNLYRGSTSGGPYTILNSSLLAGTTFTDNTVAAGQIYYYVSAAVDDNNNQSTYSNEAPATVPSP